MLARFMPFINILICHELLFYLVQGSSSMMKFINNENTRCTYIFHTCLKFNFCQNYENVQIII